MRRRSGLSWSLATLLLTRALGAQPPSSTIVLTFDASSDVQKRAIAAIRAHVSDLAAEVEVVPVEHQRSLDSQLAAAGSLAASRHALGSFYIEVELDGTLLIFFTEPEAEATLIRRLPSNPQGAGVALEQAAIVVRSLVEALLDGGNVGIAPGAARGGANANQESRTGSEPSPASAPPALPSSEEPPPSIGAEASPEADSSFPRTFITAGYTGTDFAAGMPWQLCRRPLHAFRELHTRHRRCRRLGGPSPPRRPGRLPRGRSPRVQYRGRAARRCYDPDDAEHRRRASGDLSQHSLDAFARRCFRSPRGRGCLGLPGRGFGHPYVPAPISCSPGMPTRSIPVRRWRLRIPFDPGSSSSSRRRSGNEISGLAAEVHRVARIGPAPKAGLSPLNSLERGGFRRSSWLIR
jgi:hypothetical protein